MLQHTSVHNNVYFVLNYGEWTLLLPRPAPSISTSAGNLPHFPEWLSKTSREQATFSSWYGTCRWRAQRHCGAKQFFLFRKQELCCFPQVLKLRCRFAEAAVFHFMIDFSLRDCCHWWEKPGPKQSHIKADFKLRIYCYKG